MGPRAGTRVPGSSGAGTSQLQAERGEAWGQPPGSPSSQARCLLQWPHPEMQSLPSRVQFPPTSSGNHQIRAKSWLGKAAGAGTRVKLLGSWPGNGRVSLRLLWGGWGQASAGDVGWWRGLFWPKPLVPAAVFPATLAHPDLGTMGCPSW